ncbi:MAG: hypothetical protein ACTSVV_02280 [Promethearchaeota archaeon]
MKNKTLIMILVFLIYIMPNIVNAEDKNTENKDQSKSTANEINFFNFIPNVIKGIGECIGNAINFVGGELSKQVDQDIEHGRKSRNEEGTLTIQ